MNEKYLLSLLSIEKKDRQRLVEKKTQLTHEVLIMLVLHAVHIIG
jgi:hypothetical protein